MTPMDKQKLKNLANIRSMELMNIRTKTSDDKEDDKEDEKSYIVEGYAARYEAYPLYEDSDGPIYEQFTKENFEGADRSDIILQYDHNGRVYARTSNDTLKVDVDDEGLHVVADLGKTEGARQLYEDIATGMVTKMSWRFSVPDDAYQYDKKKRLLTYSRIGRIYDVSAVSIPANDSTAISARSYVDGVIAEEKERIDSEKRKAEKIAEIKKLLGGQTNDD